MSLVWLPEAQNGPKVEVEYIKSFFADYCWGGWAPSSWKVWSSTDTDEIFYGREALLVPNKNMQKKLLIYSTSTFDPPATGLLRLKLFKN